MNTLEELIEYELNEYNNMKKETYNLINHIFTYNKKTKNRHKNQLQIIIENLESNLLIINDLENELTTHNDSSQLH